MSDQSIILLAHVCMYTQLVMVDYAASRSDTYEALPSSMLIRKSYRANQDSMQISRECTYIQHIINHTLSDNLLKTLIRYLQFLFCT